MIESGTAVVIRQIEPPAAMSSNRSARRTSAVAAVMLFAIIAMDRSSTACARR